MKPRDPYIAGVVKRLDELAGRNPDLAEPISFYKAVLPALQQAQANVRPFTLPAQVAQQKLEAGQPILVEEELPLDVKATRELFLRLCRSIESLRSASTKQIRRLVEKNALNLPLVWAAVAVGDGQSLEMLATAHQLDVVLLSLLAQTSLKPALRVWTNGLKRVVDLKTWRRGNCPFCGSLPLFTEIRGKEGERRLRCGSCGASWPYPRLQCASCGNRNHKTLGHITVNGEEEKYRLQTCDQCRGYLKVVVTFEPTPIDLLPIEDLATLHLDLIAADHGYVRLPLRLSHLISPS